MNDDLVAVVSHQDDDLEQVGGAVGADDEPTIGILSEVLNRDSEVDGVEHVFVGHAVTSGRGVDLHTGLLYYEIVVVGAANAPAIRSLVLQQIAKALRISALESCRIWVNGEEVTPETPVTERDEVAILPPVSGG